MGHVAPVQPVVLRDEQDVEQDGEEAETELGRVPEDGSPVVVVVADEEHLEDGERPAGEVEEDVTDTPANSTLPSKTYTLICGRYKFLFVYFKVPKSCHCTDGRHHKNKKELKILIILTNFNNI